MIPWLDPRLPPDFPPSAQALVEPNGLLAAGGQLSSSWLLEAYRRGIFPWFNANEPILWWTPAPRTVLFPAEFRINRSFAKFLKHNPYQITRDQRFTEVMEACAEAGTPLILLDRPFRVGDRIEVQEVGTWGEVVEIGLRTTRICTWRNREVIVPNSELISNQVTNWVLSSRYGRAIIPIGVAYGTDVEKVREILYEIVEDMPEVVKSGIVPKPKVLFREFGDSSLNFELRVFLNNIDNRLSAISEINFAIDKAFKEQGIEIPFPQRDLHVKSLPDGFTGYGRKDDQE